MTLSRIRQSIEGVTRYFSEHPDKGIATDAAAVATLQDGLVCRAEGPHGAVLVTDMPKSVGGSASAPTPGWFLRAALANCDATVIAMRAAQLGVGLTRLQVSVDSVSDNRGMFGDGVSAGPQSVRIRVQISADGTTPEQLCQIVEWAEAHSPVGDAIRRAVPSTMEVQVV
jgi:uncharacterized OsmC-like protein